MDDVGGILNAFTSKECTCYHAKVVGDDLEQAVELLSDLVFQDVYKRQVFILCHFYGYRALCLFKHHQGDLLRGCGVDGIRPGYRGALPPTVPPSEPRKHTADWQMPIQDGNGVPGPWRLYGGIPGGSS